MVKGVCSIISRYWEFLPTATIAWFVNRLVSDMAWDGATPEVRASVLHVSVTVFFLNQLMAVNA